MQLTRLGRVTELTTAHIPSSQQIDGLKLYLGDVIYRGRDSSAPREDDDLPPPDPI